jgi:hypothetical protein
MSWQVEVLIGIVVLALSVGITLYVVRLGGDERRVRQVRERLEGMSGATVTVVIGSLEEHELQSLSRVEGVVGGVQDDKLVLRPTDMPSPGAWVWPVADGTVRVRLERIVGIETADGETVFT